MNLKNKIKFIAKEVIRMIGRFEDVLDFFLPTFYLIMRFLIGVAIMDVFKDNGFQGSLILDAMIIFYIFFPFVRYYFDKLRWMVEK